MKYLIKGEFAESVSAVTRFAISREKFFKIMKEYSIDLASFRQGDYGYDVKFKVNCSEKLLYNLTISLQTVPFNIKSIKKVGR